MANNEMEKWIGLDEAANYLDIKPVTLRKWIKTMPSIPAHKIGKMWKFKCSELDNWVKHNDKETR